MDPDLEIENVTFRVYRVQKRFLQEAADAIARTRPGYTLSDYCRDLTLADAAQTLGRPTPAVPHAPGRKASNPYIQQAAVRLGMTPEQFTTRAAELLAQQALGLTPLPTGAVAPASLVPPVGAAERTRDTESNRPSRSASRGDRERDTKRPPKR